MAEKWCLRRSQRVGTTMDRFSIFFQGIDRMSMKFNHLHHHPLVLSPFSVIILEVVPVVRQKSWLKIDSGKVQ